MGNGPTSGISNRGSLGWKDRGMEEGDRAGLFVVMGSTFLKQPQRKQKFVPTPMGRYDPHIVTCHHVAVSSFLFIACQSVLFMTSTARLTSRCHWTIRMPRDSVCHCTYHISLSPFKEPSLSPINEVPVSSTW